MLPAFDGKSVADRSAKTTLSSTRNAKRAKAKNLASQMMDGSYSTAMLNTERGRPISPLRATSVSNLSSNLEAGLAQSAMNFETDSFSMSLKSRQMGASGMPTDWQPDMSAPNC